MDAFSEKGFNNVVIGIGAAILVFVYMWVFLADTSEKYEKAKVILGGKIFVVDVAREPYQLKRGLGGRNSLSEFGGMLFRFPHPDIYPIWMKGMLFPIDIIWLENHRVVYIVKHANPPYRGAASEKIEIFWPSVYADEVLEVKAGTIDRFGITVGEVIRVEAN